MENLTTSVPVAVNLIPAISTSKRTPSPSSISNQTNQSILAATSSSSSSVIQQGQQHSVIQTAHGNQLQQQLQSMHDNPDQNCNQQDGVLDDETKKRRDILSRRPSYRKILNDLSSDSPVKVEPYEESNTGSSEATGDSPSSDVGEVSGGSASVQVSSTDGIPMQSMQAIQIPTANGQSQQATVVQFNGQAYAIRGQIPQTMVMGSPGSSQSSPQHSSLAEEAARKRELRLLKNREAAKECRRKKKEYVKCLENRVAVLENQNKALIDELKALKDLYCNKTD
ncbi:cyclic AMP-responsive element-binding protein-like [Rhopilema esculentum]|uniref:cyclic AMP-responsive element-binding protein-like n=1 Tax=Rhopilema esculentum TaxID=499914 RepID=UPI0031D82370|eukprot:gene14404-5458_t